MRKHYERRDPIALGQHYVDHVLAMTAEDLHSKSAIAKELAWRDQQIHALTEQVRELREDQRKCPACDGELNDIDLPVRLFDLLDVDEWRAEWECPHCSIDLVIERLTTYKVKEVDNGII